MDPITTAIVTSVCSGIAKDAIKDGYSSLKANLKKKFGAESDIVDAVEKLEKKPDSESRQVILQEEIEIAKVNDDPDLRQLAQDLLDRIRSQSGGQEMINQTQTNTVSNVNMSGDGNFEFKPVQEGKKS
jgi:Ribonuclease G/E